LTGFSSYKPGPQGKADPRQHYPRKPPLEHAQAMAAAHESPPTTKLYDRTKERLTLDEGQHGRHLPIISATECEVPHTSEAD
jgi:hypothetical protein